MTSAAMYLQPSLHPIYARLLCMDLRRRGFTQEQILRGTGMEWRALHGDHRPLSFEQMRRLVGQAEKLSACPWLGLEVGGLTQVAAHGQLGYAAVASADVRTMLGVLTRFSRLRMNGLQLSGEAVGECYQSVAREAYDLGSLREFVYGNLASISLRLLETACGSLPLAQMQFELPFAEPEWAEQYRLVLGPHVRFAAPCYRFSMPLQWLDWPCLTADPELARLALRDCEYQLQNLHQSGGWTGRVRQRLLIADGDYPSLEALAAELHMSSRTLIRRLHDESTQYQDILDQVRQELACWLLVHTELSIEAVAERLGYSDSSNFSRTFRRWLDMPPNVFRSNQVAGEPR